MSRIAAQIASVTDDLEVEPVALPKWGVTINVRSLDGNGRSEFQARMYAANLERDDDPESVAAMAGVEKALLVETCFDPEDNSQCFTEADLEMLWTKNGTYIGKLVAAAMRVSGLSKQVEDDLGKASSDPASPAGTSSPSDSATPSDASTSTLPAS